MTKADGNSQISLSVTAASTSRQVDIKTLIGSDSFCLYRNYNSSFLGKGCIQVNLMNILVVTDRSNLSEWLEITEGTPDLGVTSYWTDAEGNVVFDPNTPKEKMKTSVTGTKTPQRKESVAVAPAKVEDKKEGNSRELETGKTTDDVPTEPKSSKSEQAVGAKENLSEKPPSVENSVAPDMPGETVEEPETA